MVRRTAGSAAQRDCLALPPRRTILSPTVHIVSFFLFCPLFLLPFLANVCGYTNRLCPAPYNTPSDFGLVAETSNPAVCYPAAHIPAPTGWTLVNPEDATQGVQIRYIDGEYSACPGESGNPRQVNYIFVCSEETPLNPFANALTDSNNPCNYTFFFSSSFACPTIEYFPLVHPVSNGLSGGSIFLILLACIIFVYVIGTMAWNAKRHQARTWHELRPHPIFWSNFLLNVRFGIHMTWLWLRSKWNRQAKEELQENEYQDMDRNYGSAGSGGVIVAGSGVVYNPLPSPAAARRGSQIVQQAPPVPTTVEEPQPKSNYSSLFASERDDILDGFHAPLTRPTEVPPPTQELYAALGEEEESGTAAAGGGDNTKEKKKKKTNKNKH